MRDGDHPTTARLRALVDDDLPADEAAAVTAHLEACRRCSTELEELEPPLALPAHRPAAPTWDETRMRRAVRRTLWRTATDVVAILGLVLIGGQLLIGFLWHPLVIDRGDRVDRHVRAAIDLPVLTTPGTHVTEFHSNASGLSRTTEAEVARVVGARARALGPQEARLGPFGEQWWPAGLDEGGLGGGPSGQQDVDFAPERLGDDVAVTVELAVTGLDLEAIDGLAGDEDVALTWVGFAPGDRPEGHVGPSVGYSTCQDPTQMVGETSGMGGFGGAGAAGGPVAPSAEQAREQTQRAVENLAETGLGDAPGVLRGIEVAEILQAFSDDAVRVGSLVLTGRVDAVAAAVEDVDPVRATMLDVDHDVGPPAPCGWTPPRETPADDPVDEDAASDEAGENDAQEDD